MHRPRPLPGNFLRMTPSTMAKASRRRGRRPAGASPPRPRRAPVARPRLRRRRRQLVAPDVEDVVALGDDAGPGEAAAELEEGTAQERGVHLIDVEVVVFLDGQGL